MTSIAIVDDVKSNRQILRKIIETINRNIAVHDFNSAESALTGMDDMIPNLVITDYKLPGQNGIELIARLRAYSNARDVPVLMITVADDVLLPTRARAAGAAAFLRRPVDYQLVRARVRSLLPRYASSRLQLIVSSSPSSVA